ncbi:hypothetical protein ACFW2Y_02135 [Streptomyces sp. NPDC058877]|uniref:hypothetical protein n=1 Tax=unclassified Streptomyces TaxID=2593676 RepID=UPI0036C3B7FF
MHADIHLQLHALAAAELRLKAGAPRPQSPAPISTLRARPGWSPVELGLRMAVPTGRGVTLAA